MANYNLFGKMRPDLQSSIDASGGAATRDGRELIVTFALQDYMMTEAADGIMIDELVHRTLRLMARHLVAQALTVNANVKLPLPEIVANLYGNLSNHIEVALDELPAVPKERVVIHRDYTRKN